MPDSPPAPESSHDGPAPEPRGSGSGAVPRRDRIFGAVVSVVLLAAVSWPALRQPPRDGFPLSTYPMFSRGRKSPRARIRHVVAIDAEGRGVVVPPRLVANEEVMQAVMTVKRAIRQGRAAQFCAEVAARVRMRVAADGGLEGILPVRLEVRTDVHDAVAYFEGQTKPTESRVHATCPVKGDRDA